jgi:hypothetical protein
MESTYIPSRKLAMIISVMANGAVPVMGIHFPPRLSQFNDEIGTLKLPQYGRHDNGYRNMEADIVVIHMRQISEFNIFLPRIFTYLVVIFISCCCDRGFFMTR